MKKSLIAVLVAAVLVASFGAVSSVYAYGGNPGGRNNGAGMQQQYLNEDGLGLYHDEILATFSDALGVSVEELEAEIDAGRTIIQIAVEDYGMSLEDAQALLVVGNFGGRGASWMGRGFATNDGTEFTPGGLFLGDGTCQIDGEYVPQYLQQGMARGRGW